MGWFCVSHAAISASSFNKASSFPDVSHSCAAYCLTERSDPRIDVVAAVVAGL